MTRISWRVALTVLAIAGMVSLTGRESPQRPAGRVVKTDGPQQAASYRHMLMADEFGAIPIDGVMRARAQVDAMRAAQVARDPYQRAVAGIGRAGWTWLGPGNKGGRVRALVVHPTTTSTIFIGSMSGGIWKTTNSGGTWAPVDDFMANLAVSTLVYQPGNPSIMYAGTGEGFYNFDRIQGAGIFKSTDGGNTWAQLASTANSNFLYVNRLAISADGATILAATAPGIYRSTDAGVSWSKVHTATTSRIDILDVKFLPGSSTNAVAAGFASNAYYSTDGGASWTIASGIGPAGSFNRVEIGVAPATPATVYLSVDHLYPSSPSGQIWRSTDSGQSYVLVSAPLHLGAQGWYDNTIWVDPTDSTRIVAGGVRAYRSTDSGVTFPTQFTGIHADFHAFVSDPGYNGTSNKRVYVGNDGGVFRNDDITTGSTFISLNNNLGITQFYGAGGNVTSGTIIGGTQDNNTVVYTPAGGANGWTTPFGGDGGYSAADPTDVNYLYGETQYLGVHRNTSGGAGSSQFIYGYRNSDGACKPAPRCLTDAYVGNANFIPPIVLDPNNANRLLAGGRSLWRSDDVKTPGDATTALTGPSWADIKTAVGGDGNISAIAVAPGNSDVVWVGHNTPGNLYVTSNGTAGTPAWTRVDNNPTALPPRTVTRVVVDPTNADIAYVAFGGFNANNVWRTSNLGGAWAQVTGSGPSALPLAPVYALAVHPLYPTWIYAGTEVGLFASIDSGANWSLPHDGPANVSVSDLFWMGTTLVAVTHGRGLYAVDTAGAFHKSSPANGATALSASPTLGWVASSGATDYEYCVDTTNDSACTSSWISAGTNTSVGLSGLAYNTTHYWQVRANGATIYAEANATAFWSFTTGPPPPVPGAFGKTSPASGAMGQATGPTLAWGASTAATSYDYCIDTSNDNACGPWVSTGGNTFVVLAGLSPLTTYYWHVRALNANGTTYAQASATAFWNFTTIVAPPPLVDLNGDGRGDIFTYDPATGNWARQVSLEGGGFQQTVGVFVPGLSVTTGHFDGDNLSDVFVFKPATGEWAKLLNNGTGFTVQSGGQWWPGWERYVLDLDGDGISDLFLHDPDTGTWFRCVSTPTGFSYTQGGWTPGWEIYPTRLDADALGDFFLINRTTGRWFWVIGTAGGFTYPVSETWYPDWVLYPGDFNGDGRTDLLLHDPPTGSYFTALNTGVGFSYVQGGWSLGWTPYVADLNADGLDDLLLHDASTGKWFEMIGDGLGNFTSAGGETWSLGWSLFATDFNGDRRIDFLLYDPGTGACYQARNLALGSFTYTGGSWGPGLTIIARPPIR